jgi:hypothetical protein
VPLARTTILYTLSYVKQVQMFYLPCSGGCGKLFEYDGKEDGLYALSGKHVAAEDWLCSVIDSFYTTGSTYSATSLEYEAAVRRHFPSDASTIASLEKVLPTRATIALLVRGYISLFEATDLDLACSLCGSNPRILIADGE